MSARGQVDHAAALRRSGSTGAAVRTGSPVCSSADLICATVHVGCRSLSSAAAPATCGVAMLVPLSVPHGPPWSPAATR